MGRTAASCARGPLTRVDASPATQGTNTSPRSRHPLPTHGCWSDGRRRLRGEGRMKSDGGGALPDPGLGCCDRGAAHGLGRHYAGPCPIGTRLAQGAHGNLQPSQQPNLLPCWCACNIQKDWSWRLGGPPVFQLYTGTPKRHLLHAGKIGVCNLSTVNHHLPADTTLLLPHAQPQLLCSVYPPLYPPPTARRNA